MSLTGKYELGTTISSAAVAFDRSIEGHQISTGRPIAVHLLAGGYNPENQKLLREIAALPPEYKACFLESGDYNGTPYIVTDSLAGTPPFRSWFSALQARRSGSGGGPADLGQVKAWQIPVRVSSQAPVKPVPQYDPGEATQLIEIPSLPPPEVKAAQPPPPVAKQEPGEFTRMFQVPASATQAPPEVEGPRGNSCVAGEFTQMFQTPAEPVAHITSVAPPAPVTPPTPIVPPKVEQQHQPSEFTQFFKTFSPEAAPAPLAPEPPPPAPVATAPPPHPPQPVSPNAEATILFQVPLTPQPPPKPVVNAAAPGEFTQMFASPAPVPQTPVQSSKSFDGLFNDAPIPEGFPRAAEAPVNAAQPGEFTRMMESPLSRAGLKPQPFSPAQPHAQPASRAGDSHEFTRMLESQASSQPEAPSTPMPARQGKPSGEATRAFRFPEAASPTPSAPPAGPSEFTQMFKAPPKEVEPPPVKAPVKPARVKPRKKPNTAYLKWILVASGILLIIALIIFFVVRD